jgi:nucleoid-associated protein YgaU
MTQLKQRLLGLVACLGILLFVIGVPLVLTAIGAVPSTTTPGTVREVLLSPDDGTLVVGMAAVVAWGAWAVMTMSLAVETMTKLRGARAPRLPGLAMPQVAASQLIAVASLLFVGASATGPMLVPATAQAGALAATSAREVTAPLAVKVAPDRALVEHPAMAAAPTVEVERVKRVETRRHIVKRGESLWSIARDQLGDGTRYVELVELNADVLGGQPDFLLSGLELRLPVDPDRPNDDAAQTRVVEPGDTLSGIALEEYDDATRYPEIFDASRDTVQPDGDRLSDPDLIRPGWKLSIPDPAAAPAQPRAVEPETEEPPATTPPTDYAPTPTPTPDVVAPPPPPAPAAEVDEGAPEEQVDDHALAAPGWLLAGLTGAGTVLAGSLFLVVRAHRRTQLRFRRPGHLIAPLPPRLADVDTTMHATGAPTATQLERLDALLRSLEAAGREAHQRPPAALAIELDGRTVILHLAQEASLPAPWTGSTTTWSRRLPDEAEDVDEIAPYPLLVAVGSDASGRIWLANLEELQTIRVTGDPDPALSFARHLVAELALAPWASLVSTDTLGVCGELAEIDTLRHDHHADGDTEFVDLLLRDLAVTDEPNLEPDSYRVLVATDSPEHRETAGRVMKCLRDHQGRPGAAVLLLGGEAVAGDVEFNLTAGGRLLVPSLDLDLDPVTMTSGEATACTAIVDLTRGAEITPMPTDGQAEHGWQALTDVSGALRPELTEPRPAEGAGEASLLPDATDTYVTAATTTVEDVQTLAPVAIPAARKAVEDADPRLDEDLEAWFSADGHLPRLVVLGPPTGRAYGDPLAVAARKPFYVELLAFIALHPRGVTTQEVATAFSLKTKRVSSDITAVRAWLGENPRTGRPHLPDARYNRVAAERRKPVYAVEDVLTDFDLFRRLRARSQARGADGIEDLVLALRLVSGTPFDDHRNGGWTWLREGEPLDHLAACAIVDVGHIVTTRALAEGDLALARFAAETEYKAAPHDEIARLDLIDVASAEGHGELAKRQLADDVYNRSDDDYGPIDLPERTAEIVIEKGWSTNRRRPSDPR